MKQILIALDQLLNTLVYIQEDGFGFADETLSARAWRLKGQSSTWRIIDLIFFWDKQHCKSSYDSEVQRKHLPDDYSK